MNLQFNRFIVVWLIGLLSVVGIRAQNKVLILGIDGCRPDALLVANTPNLDALWQSGAYSFKAKTDDLSWSGVCWTSMLTGVWKEKHKVYSNDYENPNIAEYPHFFNLAKQQNPKLQTYFIVNWVPIHNILQDNDATVSIHEKTDELVVNSVINTLGNTEVDVLFVHLDDVDHAGHAHGYAVDNTHYINAIEQTDRLVGKMVQALENRANYAKENWLILVSTDHGGSGTGHGKAIPEHTTIFYIAAGASVEPGEIKEQVYITDVAVTALKHLNISLEASWQLDGKASGLK